MNIIILCPYGARTGGPEALHQLSHALISMGFNARMWYVLESDLEFIKNLPPLSDRKLLINIPQRPRIVDEYGCYKVNILEQLDFSCDDVFVLPETYLNWYNYLSFSRVVVWWLSVDNGLGRGGMMNVNTNSLRVNRVFHACQSEYAVRFCKAMGFRNILRLTDYTPVPAKSKREKSKIAISKTFKVIFNIDNIANIITSATGIEVVKISGMTRNEVYSTLDSSFIYIDLGSFPGKDRMPREALIRDCLPMVFDAPGAEFDIPDLFKFNVHQLTSMPQIIDFVIKNHDVCVDQTKHAVQKIILEEPIFLKEVAELMGTVNSGG